MSESLKNVGPGTLYHTIYFLRKFNLCFNDNNENTKKQ